MAMVDADWSVDRATGNIRYIGDDHTLSGGTPSYATVIQFHRWIAALADDPEFTGNDEHDIIDQEATDRSTDNIITLKDYTATGGVRYNVDADAIEHLYDGTIIQGSGNNQERWDGIVNFGNPTVHIQVTQNGAILADDYWNYGKEAGTHTGAANASVLTDSTLGATVDEFVGYTIKNITDGSQGIITANTATTVTATLYGGTENDWDNGDIHHIAVPLNGDAGQGISHRFMVKTRADGVDIGRRRLLGTSRRYGNTYSEFPINGTSQGNNVLALSDTNDLNNTTAHATIDAIADITNTEGLRLIDISGDGTDEEYYSEWTRGAQTINTFYEYLKAESMDSTAATLNGQNGELHRGITHSVTYDTETGAPAAVTNDKFVFGTYVNHGAVTGGPFVVGEAVHEDTATPLWKGRVLSVDGTDTSLIIDVEEGTVGNAESFTGATSGAQATTSAAPTGEQIQNSAGELALFAIDDQGTNGVFYGQLTKGIAPQDNTRLYDPADHTDYYTCDAASTERAVSTPFVGVSTGSALIGAYGLGMVAGDTAAADTFFDLGNNPITPPNNVTMTASGFISGDYVLVTEKHATNLDINFTQMVSDTTANSATQTTISVVSIPSDTPTTAGTKGSIRVERDDGLYSLHRYTSWSSATNDFTIPSAAFNTNPATTPFNVFVGYLDYTATGTSDTFSYVYNADRDHFMRVRDGGATPIKTAEGQGTMGTNGGTISINRIDDI